MTHSQNTPGYFTEADCHLNELAALVDQVTDLGKLVFADSIEKNVPVCARHWTTRRNVPD